MPAQSAAVPTNAPDIRLVDTPRTDDSVIVCVTKRSGRIPRPLRAQLSAIGVRTPKWVPAEALADRWVSLKDAAGETRALLGAPLNERAFARGASLTTRLEPQRRYTCLNLTQKKDQKQLRQFLSGLILGAASYPPGEESATVDVVCPPAGHTALQEELVLAEATLAARTLAATPSDVKTPGWLAEQTKSLKQQGLDVATLEADNLAELGFGGVLAVGSGSRQPPNVTLIRYRHRDASRHVALVGKGITFDSGGLSLKPSASMTMMKTDMSGAAAVIATMSAIARLQPRVDVTAMIACAENMPDGAAMRPGDVITHYGGRTSEVRNTDAEGRLVLADCLAYLAEQSPDCIVDIATLTGAATVGLGRQYAALYSTDEALAEELLGADDVERTWQLPLQDDYRQAIASDVADAANSATDPTFHGGSITAALFLQPFAGEVPWAHLDIAGVGRREQSAPGHPKGATGYGARLLTSWLCRPEHGRP